MPTTATEHDSSQRRRGRRTFGARVARVWRDWWVEMLVVVFLVAALFLLFEKMSIRQTLLGWGSQIVTGIAALAGQTGRAFAARVRGTTFSDAVAYALLLAVVGLVAWRTRHRLMSSKSLTSRACPECGGELHRIHRHSTDRAINLYVPVRRYQCKNPECRWRGLRVHRSRYE